MGLRDLLAAEWKNARQLRYLQIQFDPTRCIGTWQCYEVCPLGRWVPDYENRVVLLRDQPPCVACGACVLQCPENAIRLTVS